MGVIIELLGDSLEVIECHMQLTCSVEQEAALRD